MSTPINLAAFRYITQPIADEWAASVYCPSQLARLANRGINTMQLATYFKSTGTLFPSEAVLTPITPSGQCMQGTIQPSTNPNFDYTVTVATGQEFPVDTCMVKDAIPFSDGSSGIRLGNGMIAIVPSNAFFSTATNPNGTIAVVSMPVTISVCPDPTLSISAVMNPSTIPAVPAPVYPTAATYPVTAPPPPLYPVSAVAQPTRLRGPQYFVPPTNLGVSPTIGATTFNPNIRQLTGNTFGTFRISGGSSKCKFNCDDCKRIEVLK